MSSFMYLASDQPLPKVENPHYKYMSINEAAAAGIKLPDYLSEGKFDRNDSGTVIWYDIDIDEKNLIENSITDDDFSIYPIEKSEDILTQKQYCACLEWGQYTKGQAENVIAYIREQLKQTDIVEIWHIWLSAPHLPRQIKRKRMSIADLDTQAIEKLYASDGYRFVNVTQPGTVWKDLGIEEDDLEVSIQYCYEVVKSSKD